MRGSGRRALLALPLLAFVALVAVFAFRVNDGTDRSTVPSALIGKPVPPVTFAALAGDAVSATEAVGPQALRGRVSLVNVFASWCAPCRVEHPVLMALSQMEGLTMVGINYKDRVDAAQRFLDDLGDPYDLKGVDPEGRGGIEWGVYGVPESFLVAPDGTIRARHVGALTQEALDGPFGDTLRALLAMRGAAAT